MNKKQPSASGLVYSTEHGRLCPGCGQPVNCCACATTAASRGDGVIRVSRQTKGRKGAGVTLITGVPLAPRELAELASQLKKRCGTGGTVKAGVIEIQGDHRDLLVGELQSRGLTAKKAGG